MSRQLAFSRGVREATDLESIRAILTGCVDVVKTDVRTDKKGIDYIATLRGGAKVSIDGKARSKGCKTWWKQGPELALEIYSVRPEGRYAMPKDRAKTGWTLSERSDVDMVLFTFDPADCESVYLIGFQPLRMAFRRFLGDWRKRFKTDVQDSGTWESECVFVPVDVVQMGITTASQGRLLVVA